MGNAQLNGSKDLSDLDLSDNTAKKENIAELDRLSPDSKDSIFSILELPELDRKREDSK